MHADTRASARERMRLTVSGLRAQRPCAPVTVIVSPDRPTCGRAPCAAGERARCRLLLE